MLKKHMQIISEDLLTRKRIKSMAHIVKRRETHLLKQACRYMRKVVPKLC
jgi:hypothetical protein